MPPKNRNQYEFLPALRSNGAGLMHPSTLDISLDKTEGEMLPPMRAVGRGASTQNFNSSARAKLSQHQLHKTAKSSKSAKLREQVQGGQPKLLPGGETAVDARDLNKGLMSCIERGLLPASGDMTTVLSGPPGTHPTQQMFQTAPAPMHKHIDQFKRQEILTTDIGFSAISRVKLDLNTIAHIDPQGTRKKPSSPGLMQKPLSPRKPQSPPQQAEATANDAKDREDARTYTELLDLYSLHEFIIRKGVALRQTPEFMSFQRSYGHVWGAVAHVITLLEKLLAEYGIPLAYIDGKKVVALAAVDMGEPSREELLSCIANRSEIEYFNMVSVTQKFNQGEKGQHTAATTIQACVRRWLQRRAYKHLRAATFAAILIQRQWGVHRAHMKIRKAVQLAREALIHRWRETMMNFVADWSRIKNSRRVIIHLPSLSLATFQSKSMPFFTQLQRTHLPRLADLSDEKTEIIIISPQKFEAEALQYYYTMLGVAGIREAESRVMILVPENMERLPGHLSLTKALLCSSRLMKCLSSITRGKTAYLIPSVMGNEEQFLAAKLNIPMLAPEPKVLSALSTKSGSKQVFESADVVTPIGAHNIRSEKDLFAVLAKLVSEYRDIPRWLVKLDAEQEGRGHALLQVGRLRCLPKEADFTTSNKEVADGVYAELVDSANKRLKVLDSRAYHDWSTFAEMISVLSCCVEAVPHEVLGSPTANLLIEPDGTTRLLSVQEQIMSPQFHVIGVQHPQTAVPFVAIRDAALSIGSAAYRKKVVGYVTVDFVIFRRNGQLRLWAVDWELRLTTNAMIHTFAQTVCGAQYDHSTGDCVVASSGQPLHYNYTGVIYHPYISALKHPAFFSLCRQKSLCFDAHQKTGVLFHMIDTLLCNCIGFLCVGNSAQQVGKLFVEIVDFLHQQLAAANATSDEATTNFQYVMSAARNIAQALQGEKRRQQALAIQQQQQGGGSRRR